VKTLGVHIGFQLNILMSVLGKAVVRNDNYSKECFMWKLYNITSKTKSVHSLVVLLQRKLTHSKFHSVAVWADFLDGKGTQVDIGSDGLESAKCMLSTVLPVQSHAGSYGLANFPPSTTIGCSKKSPWIGLGKIVGVLMSIIRYERMFSLNQLRQYKFIAVDRRAV
jgi:hypothetical protein